MNLSQLPLASRRPAPRRATTNGFALILVLFVLVLCAALVITLLERSNTSLKSSSSYNHSARAKVLADMTTNLVQAQIYDATTLNQQPQTSASSRDTWASQPGAIRVFTPTGTLRNIYKLYSSADLKVTTADLSADVPTDWFSKKSEFTDLNDPIVDDSLVHYPIINPNAASFASSAKAMVNGFKIKNSAPIESQQGNKAPMPVRWIYVLQDGTLCQLGDTRIDKEANPIVGRLAFWTDDETCKVNINTASPATHNAFWDTPRTTYEMSATNSLGLTQPAQNEFQRYPGHPAMVSLQPILGSLSTSGTLSPAEYFHLSPFYRWGGSEEGAKDVTASRTSLLLQKQDRRYATVDELLFRSYPEVDGGTATTLRSQLTPEHVDSLGFFLTASSRAPELNLFGQPRLSLWPIYGNPDSPDPGPTRRTPYDRLVAFNSTIGSKPYYFTREQSLHPTHDYDNITRNQQLYSYLQRATSTHVPGFAGTATFLSKYSHPNERDQILTEMFDYIRIVNLNETSQVRDSNFISYTADTDYFTDALTHFKNNPLQGAGFVVPIQIGDTRGGGRLPTITGLGLWVIRHGNHTGPNQPVTKESLAAMLTLKTCTPTHGFMPWVGPNLRFEITNATVGIAIANSASTAVFPGGTSEAVYWAPLVDYKSGNSPGGYEAGSWPYGATSNNMTGGTTPFFSTNADLTPTDTQYSILPGTVDIRMIVDGNTIQSYRFTFPALNNIPLPTRNLAESAATLTGTKHRWWQYRLNLYPFGPLLGDSLRSVDLPHGDARLSLMSKTSTASPFSDYTPHPDYTNASMPFAHSMRGYNSYPYLWAGGSVGTYVKDLTYYRAPNPDTDYGRGTYVDWAPDISPAIKDLRAKNWSGDFDNGIAAYPDGPFMNKPDEGMISYKSGWVPYSLASWNRTDGLFSPLRQIPSAVMFGSLPTGVKEGIPWRTLLFCPNPADPAHKGFSSPHDSLLLDLFRMPIVEPYAISSPAATDGKINMNYAIAPFSYIERKSAWYALLESMKILAIPDTASQTYKARGTIGANQRNSLDIEKTLEQFETRFAANDLFRSASEICSIFLVPQGATSLGDVQNLMTGFWSKHRLTGDNSREKPYAELYPKLTTQSNTYRIHLRVQVLANSAAVPAGQTDFQPLAEYRGSQLIERYLDANHPRFFSTDSDKVDPDTDNLNALYRFRVLETRQFCP